MATKYLVILSALLFTAVRKTESFHSPDGSTDCNRVYMGSHEGSLQSYNFPFDYRANLQCSHVIWLDHLEAGTREICFTFRRFLLEPEHNGDPRDYVKFTDAATSASYVYTGEGKVLNDTTDMPEEWWDVWHPDFCWTTVEDMFTVQFTTDHDYQRTGFYTTYVTRGPNQTPQAARRVHLQDECEWRCFDRSCISAEEVCNGVEDCPDGSDEMYAHARCTDGDGAPNMFACDFEGDRETACQLIDVSWNWYMMPYSTDPKRGPNTDHTVANTTGHLGYYIRSVFDEYKDSSMVLTDNSLLPTNTAPLCYSFWYHMRGNDVGTLSLHLRSDEHAQRPLWSRAGNYGHYWYRGEVALPPGLPAGDRLRFHMDRGGDWNTQVAVDDMALLQGQCTGEDVSCNFELDECLWDPEPPDDFQYVWTRKRGLTPPNGPPGDHSSKWGDGYYMHVSVIPDTGTISQARLASAPVPLGMSSDISNCLSYWYYCAGQGNAALRVLKEYNDGTTELSEAFGCDRTDYGKWEYNKVDIIDDGRAHKIVILAVIYSEPYSVALDELQLTHGPCYRFLAGACDPDQFRCENGDCIPGHYVCDGDLDCVDGSDESLTLGCNCPLGNCQDDEFCCRKGRCLPEDKVCDGENDCGDWFEEDKCSGNCDGHQCHSGRCIGHRYVCNGVVDCPDGSDESGCGKVVGNLTVASLIGIVLAVVVVVFLVGVKVTMIYYKQRAEGRCYCPCRRDSLESDLSDDEPSDSDRYQPPPSYDESADNPLYMISHNNGQGEEDDKAMLPPYSDVVAGQYVEISPVPRVSTIAQSEGHDAIADQQDDSDMRISAVPVLPAALRRTSNRESGYMSGHSDRRQSNLGRLPTTPTRHDSQRTSHLAGMVRREIDSTPPPPPYSTLPGQRSEDLSRYPPAYESPTNESNIDRMNAVSVNQRDADNVEGNVGVTSMERTNGDNMVDHNIGPIAPTITGTHATYEATCSPQVRSDSLIGDLPDRVMTPDSGGELHVNGIQIPLEEASTTEPGQTQRKKKKVPTATLR